MHKQRFAIGYEKASLVFATVDINVLTRFDLAMGKILYRVLKNALLLTFEPKCMAGCKLNMLDRSFISGTIRPVVS